ncbi:RsmE family RNA methyltransferase [Spirochaeta isovalerica]|uniref:Ribosomal RNA small subunit methyltransferase E n=1 Tax=Spirochaeta isovalerica TaxID=150 RepID=A0A841RHY1_9SPIO|nr:RsmE family RNA methyltransferase [Spirochaeta isovalerica]MBB6481912.1 RsmE family RNA methyltransferase [Spirochaeta isovalerica]
MNLILFENDEINNKIPSFDLRYQHIRTILKLGKNDSFDCGIINGPGGRAMIKSLDSSGMVLEFDEQWTSPRLYPLTLIIGVPRPPTARRLLKDLTSTGVDRIWFTGTELGEKSYLTSKIWQNEKYREYVLEGAQQGESTLLPEVRRFHSLRLCLEALEGGEARAALDNNESVMPISRYSPEKERNVIAIGSERGWTEGERTLLKDSGFSLLSMGTRVLRTETACAMAAGFTLAAMGKI